MQIVRYIGNTGSFSGATADPSILLEDGLYKVERIDMYSFCTNYYLEGYIGSFDPSWFEYVAESGEPQTRIQRFF